MTLLLVAAPAHARLGAGTSIRKDDGAARATPNARSLLKPAPSTRPHDLTTWAKYEHFKLAQHLSDNRKPETDLLKVLPELHQDVWRAWVKFDAHYDALEYQSSLLSPSSGGGCSWAYVSEHESHGNYNAVNPTTGAYGRWQIIPSTARDYGCDLSTHSGQDACAQKLYAARGFQPWSVCG